MLLIALFQFNIVLDEVGFAARVQLPVRHVEHVLLLLRRRGLSILLTHLSPQYLLWAIQLAAVAAFHAYLALRLDAALGMWAIARCILLEITHFLQLLLGTLICLLGRDVEVGASCGQTRPLWLARHLEVSLQDRCLILLHQAFYIRSVDTMGEQVFCTLGSAVWRGAHRLDGQAEVRIGPLFAQYFLDSILLLWIARLVVLLCHLALRVLAEAQRMRRGLNLRRLGRVATRRLRSLV